MLEIEIRQNWKLKSGPPNYNQSICGVTVRQQDDEQETKH